MDYDEEDFNDNLIQVENLVKKDKKKFECNGKYIIFLIFGNLTLIVISVLIIYKVHETKINKMSYFFSNYLKNLTNLGITNNRIKYLVKEETEDKYQTLVNLEKLILNTTWGQINNTAKKELDELISTFLFPNEEINDGISESLTKILTLKENNYIVYQLLDEGKIKELEKKFNDENDNKETELFANKLKAIILYGLINLPLQITYFSKDNNVKHNLIDAVIEKLVPNTISDKINHLMEEYNNNIYNLYMVLGSGQLEERKRINTKVQNNTFINFVNTGLRIQSTQDEIDNSFKNSFEEYYINESYKELMKSCSADGIMNDSIYKNFIEECKSLSSEKYTNDIMQKINELFNKYTFSVETANTIIEFIKLNVPLDKIHIIRLGQKYRHHLMNEVLKYNASDAYILYNVYDIDTSTQNIKRATTEANIKAINYLKEECPNFLNEDDYNKFILVSSQGNAERQLEAFNIISNIYNYSIQFDAVIWNKNYTKELDGNKIIEYILDCFVKSTNLIATSFLKVNKFQDEIKNFVEAALNLTEKYK